jgi:hypothetical protein
MIPLPKPRSFWDYTLFALMLTGLLVSQFWAEANGKIGWADVALALAASVLCVLVIILFRGGEKTALILGPGWHAKLLTLLGAIVLIFGATYADRYFLHRMGTTASRFRHDMVFGIAWSAVMLLSLQIRNTARR